MSVINSLWAWVTEHATVIATVVSALAACAVVIFTKRLAQTSNEQGELTRESVGIAKIAADAAKKSADVSIAAERAYLFIDEIFGQINWPITTEETRTSQINIVFKNHGKTPAVLREMYWGIVLHPYLPNLQDSEEMDGGPFPMSAVVQAGGKSEPYGNSFQIDGKNVDAILSGTELMCLVGRILYDDVFGQRHETHFCRQYWNRSKRFDFAVSDHLNRYT